MTFDLNAAFKHKQKTLALALEGVGIVSHPSDKGDISESNWIELLTKILPARYGVSKATIVDSSGGAESCH